MRITPSWDASQSPRGVSVTASVKADPPGLCCPLMLLLLVLCIPLYVSIRSSAFESTRWNDSVMQPVDYTGQVGHIQTWSDDDDDDE